jgi:SprT protein
MMTATPFSSLEKYVPEGTAPAIEALLKDYSVLIKIKKARKTKFGDYRLIKQKWKHQITINHDLNKYAFLVTLLHEIAHMYTFEKYEGKVPPHGKEWKDNFSKLLIIFFDKNVFPADIEKELLAQLSSPTASSCTDVAFYKALKKYDTKPQETNYTNILTHLENLAEGEHFIWRENKVFRKEGKLRKRYRCIEVKTKKIYLFHPLAEVEKVK